MSKKAIEYGFTDSLTAYTTYDPSVITAGPLINKFTDGGQTFVGPLKIAMARPMEQSTAIPGIYPHVITYNSTTDYVFLADFATAAATRRIICYEYNKVTSEYTWKGFITLTYPTATNHTITSLRVIYDKYTTGTVSGSGTAITGSGTAWSSSRLTVGSRIGFGSTDPNQISTWYEISAIGSDTSITLTSSAGSIAGGTSYVIEDLRVLTTTTNATATNGGLFQVKGLRFELFTIGGTTIPAATTVDNIRAVYWLSDAATLTNTAPNSIGLEDRTSWTSQNIYVLNGTSTTARIFKYNIRAALTLTGGKDNGTSLVLQTGNQTVTGNISGTNNGRVGTLNHGPGSGVTSFYFVTTTRIYRCATSNITAGSTTFISDNMVEIPPGGTSTYAATSTMSSVEISSQIDRLIVTNTGASGARSYITQYNSTSNPIEYIFLIDDKVLNQTTSDSDAPLYPSIQALPFSVWSENGILHLARHSNAATNNQLYSVPLVAHWDFTTLTNNVLITPSINTSDANKFYKFYINHLDYLGDDIINAPIETFKSYYRTSGINDNSGSWTLINRTGDLSSVTPGSQIQFMFTFKVIGSTCIPPRLLNLALTYEDNGPDSHYEPSVSNSNLSNRIFAYRQSTAWGSNIPNMRIRLYNASTGVLLIDDDVTSSSFGAWEYSTDGGSNWLSWSSSADLVGNYIRYTATSLPDGVRVRSLLTQN